MFADVKQTIDDAERKTRLHSIVTSRPSMKHVHRRIHILPLSFLIENGIPSLSRSFCSVTVEYISCKDRTRRRDNSLQISSFSSSDTRTDADTINRTVKRTETSPRQNKSERTRERTSSNNRLLSNWQSEIGFLFSFSLLSTIYRSPIMSRCIIHAMTREEQSIDSADR